MNAVTSGVKRPRGISRHTGSSTLEWLALLGVVVICGVTIATVLEGNLKVTANNTATNITACEMYAASHGGSTAGCY